MHTPLAVLCQNRVESEIFDSPLYQKAYAEEVDYLRCLVSGGRISSSVLHIIPAVLACPDRHSSCCSRGLCVQRGPSGAAGTSVSPDVMVQRTPSAEGC